MIVMKFGGASLADRKNIEKTCNIVTTYKKKDKVVLIVSAMKGVTDQLYEIVRLIDQRKFAEAKQILEKLRKQHLSTLNKISTRTEAVKVKIELIKLFEQLQNFINNAGKKGMTPAREDFIVSFGERWSCRLIAEALEMSKIMAYPIDASFLMATNNSFGNALPLYDKTQDHLRSILLPLINKNIVPVITGFIGFTNDGCTTTLGRGGSDLSAAFFANFLNAKGLYLWKDVEGFFTADPHKDSTASLFKRLSYKKAKELALKGAKVIYHKAIDPVAKKHIPLYVKSFLNTEAKGTVIQ